MGQLRLFSIEALRLDDSTVAPKFLNQSRHPLALHDLHIVIGQSEIGARRGGERPVERGDGIV
jgi:hypothetical protein